MTQADWLNIANCARARREASGLSSWWTSPDYPHYVELMCAETALFCLMCRATLGQQP